MRTAPEGLVPLDSLPSPAGGTGDYLPACAVLSRQNVKNTGFSKTAVPYYGSSRFFVNLSCEKMYLGQAAEMDGRSCSQTKFLRISDSENENFIGKTSILSD